MYLTNKDTWRNGANSSGYQGPIAIRLNDARNPGIPNDLLVIYPDRPATTYLEPIFQVQPRFCDPFFFPEAGLRPPKGPLTGGIKADSAPRYSLADSSGCIVSNPANYESHISISHTESRDSPLFGKIRCCCWLAMQLRPLIWPARSQRARRPVTTRKLCSGA
jgi:hypothetical protein